MVKRHRWVKPLMGCPTGGCGLASVVVSKVTITTISTSENPRFFGAGWGARA